MTERENELDEIAGDELPDPELHELADAVETEADADAGHDPGHDPAGHLVDEHGHTVDEHDHVDHGDHDGHGAENPRWVVPPLLVGMVIGLIVLFVLGLASGAVPFT